MIVQRAILLRMSSRGAGRVLNQGDIRSRHYQVQVIADRCKGCGFCIEFCPKHVLSKSTEINSKGHHTVRIDNANKCTGCNICSMVCPDFAISVVPIKKKPVKEAEAVRV